MKSSRIIILVFFLGLFLSNCNDQEGLKPDTQGNITFYNETGTEKLNRVINLSDGGFLYIGKSNNEAFAMRVGSHGDRQWYTSIPGWGGTFFSDAVETADGKLVLVGTALSHEKSPDKYAGLVVTLSAAGEVEWKKVYYSPLPQQLFAVMVTPDGYIVATGDVEPSDADTWLLKLTMSGDEVWSQDYTYLSDWHDIGLSIIMSPEGDYVISGLTSPDASPLNNRKFDTYLIAIDPNDAELVWGWAYRQYPTVVYPGREASPPRVIGLDDGYAFTMTQYDQDTVLNVRMVKTDLAGNDIFSKKYYGLGTAINRNIQETSDGGFLINGTSKTLTAPRTTGQAMMLKLSASGEEEWSTYIGGKPSGEEAFQSHPTSDGWKHAGYSVNSKRTTSLIFFKTGSNGSID